MLVNPAHLRGVKGRKTDPSDAAFLARAAASGMVLASFVPARAIRELRELTRRRTEIRADRGREIQRLEKELEDSGLKLTSVLTDVTGVSARAGSWPRSSTANATPPRWPSWPSATPAPRSPP